MDKGKLIWNIGTAMRMHRVLVNRQASEAGVYMGQHHVMAYIARHPGCSQNDIATALDQSPAAISLATKRLQELGLINKFADEGSLRINRLSITEKGKNNGDRFFDVLSRFNDRVFDGFTEEEMEQMSGFIDRLTDNMRCCLSPEDEENLNDK